MGDKSKVKSIMQKVNGLNFYCELRGRGPTIVLVPSGEGDCGSFTKVADMLADEFTVFTLDMRGMSRSERPAGLGPMTAGDLASDVAGLLKALDLAPASVYGCSSGGQCALSMGLDYPEVCRNLMIHEAALTNDAPPGAKAEFYKGIEMGVKLTGSKNIIGGPASVGDPQAWAALGPEYHERISKNGEVWVDYVLGYADQRTYSEQELYKMPPLVFSIGYNSAAWLAFANLQVASRANAEVVWLPCLHFPQVTIPDQLARHIRKHTKKHLRSGR
jgi:pimeloyl-ACP methyl ester carboxylesterase